MTDPLIDQATVDALRERAESQSWQFQIALGRGDSETVLRVLAANFFIALHEFVYARDWLANRERVELECAAYIHAPARERTTTLN